MAKRLYLFLVVSFFASSALAATYEIEYEGRKVTITEDNPYRNEIVELTESRAPNNQGKHSVRAYGSMWITFMASMIATELAYCNNYLVPVIANNDETPTCRSELQAMLFDPGMNLGVLAMTATSIEVYKRGNRQLIRIMRKLTRGTRALKLSRVMLSHLSMGAGMIVQTSVASSWNAPQMRKCMAGIYSNVKSALATHNITDLHADEEKTREVVSQATQEAHEESDCVKARKEFFNAETGTLSEINITVLSLGISSAISGALVTGIRFAGMALLGWNPAGLGMMAGMLLAEPIIEMTDRILEPIIRAFYHSQRSKYLLSASFLELVGSLEAYKKDNKFMTYHSYQRCKRFDLSHGPLAYQEQDSCLEEETVEEYGFALRDALDSYKKNIDYRKRARLNRFIETHNRWKQKLSNIFTSLKAFQDLMAAVYDLRTERQSQNISEYTTYYNFLSPLTYVEKPEDISVATVPDLLVSRRSLNQDQIHKVYSEIFKPLIEKVKSPGVRNRNENIKRVLLELDAAFKDDWNLIKIRAGLWRLKSLFSSHATNSNYGFGRLNDGLYGHVFSEEELLEIQTKLTNAISSFDTYKSRAFLKLEGVGMPLLAGDQDQMASAEDETTASRKGGMIIDASPPESALLLMNKDDSIPFRSNEVAFWTNRVNEGLQAGKLASKVITHLLCGESPHGLDFFWKDGNESRLALPNILKNPELLNCNYKDRITNYHLPDQDFFYISSTDETRILQPDEAMARVFTYAEKEHIGLLEILIDPRTELIWPTFEDFDRAWKEELRPKFFRFLLTARQEYFESIQDYFQLFYRPENETNVAAKRGLLSREELTYRTANNYWFLVSNSRDYYSKVYTGDAYVDEFKTYAYLVRELQGEGHQNTSEIERWVTEVFDLVHYLDTKTRDLSRDYSSLSQQESEEKIYTHPLEDSLGAENIEGYIQIHKQLKQEISSRFESLTSENPIDFESIADSEITPEVAKLLLLYKVYKNANESLDELYNTILKEYIGGASITYIDQK